MSAKAKPTRGRRTEDAELSARLTKALTGLLVVAASAGALAMGVWRYAHEQMRRDGRYLVRVEEIQLLPAPPAWVRTDLRRDVLGEGSLDRSLSILEPNLAQQITQAFQLNPWVAKVERVSKLPPARLEVRLQYRRPVCMVETPRGLVPIDVNGVLLPGEHFSPLESQNYPRLVGIRTPPLGPVGTAWGDPLTPGGAQIAAILLEHWQALGLRAIVPITTSDGLHAPERIYDLYTLGGARVIWGSPPGGEPPGESTAAEKLARLQKYAAVNGSLDSTGGPSVLDLRQELPTPQRTAEQPSDEAVR